MKWKWKLTFTALAAGIAGIAAAPPESPRVEWKLVSTGRGGLPLPGLATQQTASVVCDLDKDGKNDFVIASRREEAAVVWYRRRAWGWEKHLIDGDHLPIEAGGTFMDVDGDGDLDLIFGEDNTGNKVWWWENPYPNFDPKTPWKRRAIKNSGGNKHHDQLVGDFDGDGKDELVFWNQGKAARKLFLARVPENPRTTEPWPLVEIFSWKEGDYEGLAKGDIDGDAKTDIVGGGMWFKHMGGDKFEAKVIDASQSFSRAAVRQLKKGGSPEVVFAPGDRDGPLQWYEQLDGKWVAHKFLDGAVIHGHSLDIGDVDGDGNADVLCGEMRKWGPDDNAGARMWVFFGDGKGKFEASELPRGFGHHEAKLADLDGDGTLDILDKPYIWNTPAVHVWLNRRLPKKPLPLGMWERHEIDSDRPWKSVFVFSHDIDGDGQPDIITGAWWYKNPGTPGGQWVRNTIGAPVNNAAALFDFDNDGRIDILGSGWRGEGGDPSFAWARNHGGSFTVFENVPKAKGDFLQGAAAARYQAGGPIEVGLSWHKRGGGVQMLTVPGNPMTEPWKWRAITETTQDEDLSAGDIGGEGRTDLLLGTMLLRNEPAEWKTFTLHQTDERPDRNRLADINGDGRLDAVVGFESISKPGKLSWYEQPEQPGQPWSEHVIAPNVTGPMSLDVADMDGDGDLDIVVGEHNLQEPATARLLIFENADGRGGRWKMHETYKGDEHHDGALVVDIDGDGDLDIVSIGWGHKKVLLYENKAIDRSRSVAEEGGRFLREHWFAHSMENGNPVSNKRFRVNAPEVVLHPNFGKRSEVRSSGMLQIQLKEDLSLLEGADLYIELWGGHPGTANKRVTVNGRSTYAIPEVGTAAGKSTHQYPAIPLRLTDLVSGYNAIQFACDKGKAAWGHYIVEGAALRAVLRPEHPDLLKSGLQKFSAVVTAAQANGKEAIRLSLNIPAEFQKRVAEVRFQGLYDGYDENGGGKESGWHGFTLGKEPIAYLGVTKSAPFAADWDVSMLPAQTGVAARAFVYFNDAPGLVYVTRLAGGLNIAPRQAANVRMIKPAVMPAESWSRVNKKITVRIPLDMEPSRIERAQLHMTVWDGGCGAVKECVTLNGHPLPVTGSGHHNLIYSRLDIKPSMLKQGDNVVEVRSDTEHHGIEVMLPGPALFVRTK